MKSPRNLLSQSFRLHTVGLGFALLAASLFLCTGQARAELIYGLTTGNTLVSFDSATPGAATALVPISGVGGETIFDIDIRPADGLLYGFSSAGRLYSINPITGLATLNASLTGPSLDPNATRFSIDFNPTVDRLRIVSNTGQDLRLTPGSGVTTVDSNLNGASTRAVSVAYTNNDTNPATGTTLFYIDTPGGAATVYNTSNPNGGVMSLVGPAGVSSTDNIGFDISGLTSIAYASFSSFTGAPSMLYQINLTNGAATLVGTIGAPGLFIRGIAAPINAPETGHTLILLALAAGVLFVTRRAMISRRLEDNGRA